MTKVVATSTEANSGALGGEARHVAMITEGTYPHFRGGVSVWCDQMVRQLGGSVRFSVHALVGSGSEPIVWDLPDNVVNVQTVPLWSPGSPLPPKRRQRVHEPAVERLIGALGPHSSLREFANSIGEVVDPARAGALSSLLSTPAALDLMLAQMQSDIPGRPLGGDTPPPATARDAMEALALIEHFLRPLGAPLPRAELCHCISGGLGALVAMLAKADHGTPFVLGEHGLYLRERLLAHPPGSMAHHVRTVVLRFYSRLTELSYDAADVIVPVCNYNRLWEQASGAVGVKIRPIHNGVEPEQFPPAPPEPSQPTLVWLGRIDAIKDVETLLRAFALIRSAVPDVHLRIFGPDGDPTYSAQCRALARDLGVAEHAVFEGRVEVDKVVHAYQAGQVVLFTSISEGFPFAVLEAMAAGRPVVASDVGGVKEAVGADGVLVPPRRPEALADAALRLLVDPERRRLLGEAGRRRVLSLFTLEGSAERYASVYDDLGQPSSEELAPLVPFPTAARLARAGSREETPAELAMLGEEVS
jgi:glycosyltransferase involved in cell wall biosynthesis